MKRCVKHITDYIVVKCRNCQTLTFIRRNQKTATCKKCGIRNKFEKIKTFSKATLASEYIREIKLKNSDYEGGFGSVV